MPILVAAMALLLWPVLIAGFIFGFWLTLIAFVVELFLLFVCANYSLHKGAQNDRD